MSFNKIQPEQVQMPIFFSDSGGLNISQTDTGIQLNVSKNLTGNFNFTGDLLTNGKPVFGVANTGDNFFLSKNDTVLFQGSNTQIRGTGNMAFKASESQISGRNNVALNVNTATFLGNAGSVAENNTALHGRGIVFGNSISGSVVMKDYTTTSQTAYDSHALYSNFKNGHFFEAGGVFVEKSISTKASGVISGDLKVLGSGFLTGQEITTKHYLTGYASGNYANLFGDQTIGGEKTISSTMRFDTGFAIPLWSGNASQAGTNTAPATGSLAISGTTLCVYMGSAWRGVAISGIAP
jgi:hypothetical protein|tara:strand:+ start:43 stop:927 length:885 start_codon:yes stop_codon:yes gene_type:complete